MTLEQRLNMKRDLKWLKARGYKLKHNEDPQSFLSWWVEGANGIAVHASSAKHRVASLAARLIQEQDGRIEKGASPLEWYIKKEDA
jgi:hypothetical protein